MKWDTEEAVEREVGTAGGLTNLDPARVGLVGDKLMRTHEAPKKKPLALWKNVDDGLE